MTRVFVAGPIDFQDLEDVVEYRLEVRGRLEREGFTPVDQYSELLELLVGFDFEENDVATFLAEHEIPDEPFVRAAQHAVTETSLETVLDDPGVVPRHTPDAVIEDLVDRDLSLLESSAGLLGYLPEPSCGTMAEIIHAHDNDVPAVVISERPPHYVRHYADETVDSVDAGIERLRTLMNGGP